MKMLLLSFLLSSLGPFCSVRFRAPHFIWRNFCLVVFLACEDSSPASSEEIPLVSSHTHSDRPQGSGVKHTEIVGLNTLNGYCDQIHATAAALLWQQPCVLTGFLLVPWRTLKLVGVLVNADGQTDGTHAMHSLLFITSNQSEVFSKNKKTLQITIIIIIPIDIVIIIVINRFFM